MEGNTRVDEDGIRQTLGLFGIASQNARVTPLHRGDDNVSVLVSVAGACYVLRLYRLTPPAEISFELELIDFLSSHDFPTPRVHRRPNGAFLADVSGVPAALFDFAEGRHIDDADPGDVGRIAALFARMHVLTSGMVFAAVRTRTDVGRLRHFQELASTNRGLAQRVGVDEFLASIMSLVTEWKNAVDSAAGSVPFGLIHHDPSSGNILLNDEHEIAALLDFDEAYQGPLVIDIAALLHYWALETGPHSPHLFRPWRLRQLSRGYEHVRRLTAAERHLLPTAMLIFSAADAAEYLARSWMRDPTKVNLDDSISLASFRALRDGTDWREQLASEFGD